jgi:hypothetical protein
MHCQEARTSENERERLKKSNFPQEVVLDGSLPLRTSGAEELRNDSPSGKFSEV